MIAVLALAVVLAAPPAPAAEDACFAALDASTARVDQLEAQLRDLRRRLAARSSTTTTSLVCAPQFVCPAQTSCEGRPAWLDLLTHAGAMAIGGLVVRGLER